MLSLTADDCVRVDGAGHEHVGHGLVFRPKTAQRADRIRIAVDSQVDVGKRLPMGDQNAGGYQRSKFAAGSVAGRQCRYQAVGERCIRLSLECG